MVLGEQIIFCYQRITIFLHFFKFSNFNYLKEKYDNPLVTKGGFIFNSIFNNSLVIMCLSILSVKENSKKKLNPISHWQTLFIKLCQVHLTKGGKKTHNFSGDRHCLHRYIIKNKNASDEFDINREYCSVWSKYC